MEYVIDCVKKIFIIIVILSSPYTWCSEEILLTRYGYGLLIWDGVRHDKPGVWSYLSETDRINDIIYPNFQTSDDENKATQERYKFYVQLVVQQKDKHLQATVIFKNQSMHPYFLHRQGIMEPHGSYFYPLCSNAFSITTGGILLNFLKMKCIYYIEDEQYNWKKIPANSIYSFTVNLNEAYAFLPGKRRYNIGSMEYNVVTEGWRREQSIYKSFFSIMEWEYTCEIQKNISYIEYGKNVCEPGKLSFSSFLYTMGYEGERDDNHFRVRTNQVITYVDGKTLKPFYENQY